MLIDVIIDVVAGLWPMLSTNWVYHVALVFFVYILFKSVYKVDAELFNKLSQHTKPEVRNNITLSTRINIILYVDVNIHTIKLVFGITHMPVRREEVRVFIFLL
jgi:hypothetical protein